MEDYITADPNHELLLSITESLETMSQGWQWSDYAAFGSLGLSLLIAIVGTYRYYRESQRLQISAFHKVVDHTPVIRIVLLNLTSYPMKVDQVSVKMAGSDKLERIYPQQATLKSMHGFMLYPFQEVKLEPQIKSKDAFEKYERIIVLTFESGSYSKKMYWNWIKSFFKFA